MLTTSQRARYLPLAMRVFGVIWSLIGTTFVLTPTLARWHPYNTAYEHMFAALFVTWGILLLRGANNPEQAMSIIDFSILEGFLHGGAMVYDAIWGGHPMYQHFLSDIPLHLFSGMIFLLLRPRPLPRLTALEIGLIGLNVLFVFVWLR